ncbi:MAG TPA: c-type cytochrome [Woeseiaceae bacterium]|nr:c-type cytochrome [Woeseiaceae bacterium]
MKMNIVLLIVLAGLNFIAIDARAASLVDGDAKSGEAKSAPCSACHGAEGNSMSPIWPNLAGQAAPYIVAQLKAFKSDPNNPDAKALRSDPLMTPQAMMLSDQDINDLAVYYESLPVGAQAVADPDLISRGEALWRAGNSEEGVAACAACHGPTGRGNPAASYPLLAGQHSAYIAKQLNDYAAGKRRSDGKTRIMRDISERLNQEDITALASYVQGLK